MGTTHYAYISGPNHYRQVTATFDLKCATLDSRRQLIHALLAEGECLAAIPSYFDGEDDVDIKLIESFLDGVLPE